MTLLVVYLKSKTNYYSSAGIIKANEYGNSRKTFTLSDGELFEVKGLPSSTCYQISEEAGNYDTSYLIRKNNVTEISQVS